MDSVLLRALETEKLALREPRVLLPSPGDRGRSASGGRGAGDPAPGNERVGNDLGKNFSSFLGSTSWLRGPEFLGRSDAVPTGNESLLPEFVSSPDGFGFRPEVNVSGK